MELGLGQLFDRVHEFLSFQILVVFSVRFEVGTFHIHDALDLRLENGLNLLIDLILYHIVNRVLGVVIHKVWIEPAMVDGVEVGCRLPRWAHIFVQAVFYSLIQCIPHQILSQLNLLLYKFL